MCIALNAADGRNWFCSMKYSIESNRELSIAAMGQYGCNAFLSSVAEISSTKTLFFRIPVLLSDLLCFFFNWIFHYGSNLGVEMGRIPLLGQDPVQVLVF